MPIQFNPYDPVNRAFWLGALHLARLPELDELAEDPVALEATFDELWSDRVDRAVADELIADWGPEVPGRRHLVALAWFIEDKGLRAIMKGQRARCLWLTGLSGSGKSTLANLLEKRLYNEGKHTYVLDGDNVRHGLNRDLGFSEIGRAHV